MSSVTTADASDPRAGLAAAARLRRASERTEAVQVRRARTSGLSEEEIAAALGVSRRTLVRKHGRRRPGGGRR
jgi:DNA-binding transcriptional regulator YiaG